MSILGNGVVENTRACLAPASAVGSWQGLNARTLEGLVEWKTGEVNAVRNQVSK